MGEYKRYTDEQIEQAKNADLVEFVRSHGLYASVWFLSICGSLQIP